jgi:hypothetical protein
LIYANVDNVVELSALFHVPIHRDFNGRKFNFCSCISGKYVSDNYRATLALAAWLFTSFFTKTKRVEAEDDFIFISERSGELLQSVSRS